MSGTYDFIYSTEDNKQRIERALVERIRLKYMPDVSAEDDVLARLIDSDVLVKFVSENIELFVDIDAGKSILKSIK